MVARSERIRPRILVIEDEPYQRELYDFELTDRGYEVMLAGTVAEADRIIDEDPPDLVVLDLRMPGLDGVDLLGRLLLRDEKVPVVINTSYPRYRSGAASARADAFVLKSADLTELVKKIREVLRRNGRPRHARRATAPVPRRGGLQERVT